MAKLNKMEISAIAEKIANDIHNSVDEYNKIYTEKEYNRWLSKFIKTREYKVLSQYNDIQEELIFITKDLSYNYRIDNLDFDEVFKAIFKNVNKLELKTYKINKFDIERDIIIAQAKNEDLDKLIKDLTEKYSV